MVSRRARAGTLGAGILAVALALGASSSFAHDLRPAMLRVELAQASDGSGDTILELHLRLPPQVSAASAETIVPRPPAACRLGDPEVVAERRSWRGRCEGRPAGRLEIDGLGRGLEVVVDLRRPGARPTTAVLHGGAASVALGVDEGRVGASGYLGLGIEHILGGLDHLLFVVGLVLLGMRARGGEVRRRGPPILRLLGLLTAFTVAHSLTLAAAVLGWLRLPAAPVEACIALSIVLLAREVVRPEPQMRSPWGFAFVCGLLHGLGFAGALAEVGLPSEAIASALLLFNAGVELGQVAVAMATLFGLGLAVGLGFGRLGPAAERTLRIVLGTALGSLAVAWTLERALAMFP